MEQREDLHWESRRLMRSSSSSRSSSSKTSRRTTRTRTHRSSSGTDTNTPMWVIYCILGAVGLILLAIAIHNWRTKWRKRFFPGQSSKHNQSSSSEESDLQAPAKSSPPTTPDGTSGVITTHPMPCNDTLQHAQMGGVAPYSAYPAPAVGNTYPTALTSPTGPPLFPAPTSADTMPAIYGTCSEGHSTDLPFPPAPSGGSYNPYPAAVPGYGAEGFAEGSGTFGNSEYERDVNAGCSSAAPTHYPVI